MGDSQWIRKATFYEEAAYSFYGHSKGLVLRSVLRMTTSREITIEDVRNVFTALYRTIPVLRTHLSEKDGEIWLRYNSEERIDCEAIENADIEQAAQDLSKYDFNPDGPFWVVRWLPWSNKHSDYVEKTKLSISNDADGKYTSHFIVAFHHGINDGYSSLQIIRNTMQLFNDLIAGTAINYEKQLTSLLYMDEDLGMMEAKGIEFAENEDLYNECLKSFKSILVDNMINKVCPKTSARQMLTIPLLTIFDEETTSKFLNHCKTNGVTVNSGLIAAINAAFVQFLTSKGIVKNEYSVPSLHFVDMRSYFPHQKESLGIYVGDLHTDTVVPANALEDFWSCAKSIHSSFKEKYKRCSPFENIILEEKTGFSPFEPINLMEDVSNEKVIPFLTSNMMDVTGMLGNIGEHVRLEFVDFLTSIHLFKTNWQSAFQVFHGQLIHSLEYNAYMIDENTAQELSDAISKVLRTVSQ